MGRSTGFEPATSGTTNRRSNQLSYDRHTPPERCRESGTYTRAAGRQPALRNGACLLHNEADMGSEKAFRPSHAQLSFVACEQLASGYPLSP